MKKLLIGLFSAVMLVSQAAYAEKKIIDTDVVVVGSGLAGLSAAANSSELGLNTYLIEKANILGGSGPFVEGTFAVGSKMQINENVMIDVEQAWRIAMDYSHWAANGDVLRVLIKRSGETIDWFADHGVVFHKVHNVVPGSPRVWHLYENGSGSTAVVALLDVIKKTGGHTMTDTTGKKLITDSQNNIIGLIAQDSKGNEIQFNAKAVILATGGFANNKEMLERYVNNPDMIVIGPQKGRDGDGIKMSQEVGAIVEGMNTILPIGAIVPNEDPNNQLNHGVTGQMATMLRQPLLWINSNGDRFVDEGNAANWVSTHNAVERNGKYYYIVFDEKTKNEMIQQGTLSTYSNWVPAGTPLNKLNEGLQLGEQKGYVYKANSIEELAKKLGVNPKSLKQTVDSINLYTKQGRDESFFKHNSLLRTVEQGPFYAIKGMPAFLNTTGGVRVNTHMQALDSNSKPIKGLYLAGVDIGGLFGASYDLQLAGTLSGYAVVSGKIAAEHIAQEIKK